MAVTYDTATKTARMTATRDECANGTLELRTSGDAVLANRVRRRRSGRAAQQTRDLGV